MSTNPFATPDNNTPDNGAENTNPYGGQDPAAQYSAQNQYGQANPAQPGYDQNAAQQPGYGQAPNYGAPAYGQQPGYPQGYAPTGYDQQMQAQMQGQKHSQTSLIFGVIGLITGLGLILGWFAISFANKAQKLGVSATAGKVLGWISIIISVIGTIFLVIGIAAALNDPTLMQEFQSY